MIKIFYSVVGLLLLSLGITQTSYALQIYAVTNHGSVNATIAMQELTRISIDQDRITHVYGLEGTYELKQDPAQGVLYIKPTLENVTKPFTLFISTEQNFDYVLHLTPSDQLGDTLLLKSRETRKRTAQHWEESTAYITSLTHLVRHMMKETIPPSYIKYLPTKTKKYRLSKNLLAQPVCFYSGSYLQGKVYRITNRSSQRINLNEVQFYCRGDCSIALSQLTILPHGEVFLYKVSSHD